MWRGWGWQEEEREAETRKRTGERGSQGWRVAHDPRPAVLGAWPQRSTWPLISLVSLIISTPRAKGKTSGREDVLAKTRAFLAAPGHSDLFRG